MAGAIATAVQKQQTAISAQDNRPPATIKDHIRSMKGEIARALPSTLTPERFERMVLSALSANPKLAQCTSASFLGAMMTAAQLGLEPNTPLGQAYIIPYGNKATFQLGYKGLLDLAYRSGEISVVYAQTVYENDIFHYEFGLEPKLEHKPADGDKGNPVAFYAVFRTKDNGYGFEVDTVDRIRKHAERYSRSYSDNSSPWKTDFESMAKKTMLKRVLKYAPLKVEYMRPLAHDETVKNEISDDMYNVPAEYIDTEAQVLESEATGVIEAKAEVA